MNMALSSIITGEERSYGNISLDFDGDVYLDNGASVHLEDLFSGNYDNPATSLSGIVAAVVYYLTNNEFKDVGIFRIDLNIRAVEEARLCRSERVLLDKYSLSRRCWLFWEQLGRHNIHFKDKVDHDDLQDACGCVGRRRIGHLCAAGCPQRIDRSD